MECKNWSLSFNVYFLISCTRQVQYCRYYNIRLCDQINAVLKHSGLPRSRCLQIENTDSKLEEKTGISQITELSIVNWAIMMCTFLFLLTRLATERKQEEICWEFSLSKHRLCKIHSKYSACSFLTFNLENFQFYVLYVQLFDFDMYIVSWKLFCKTLK